MITYTNRLRSKGGVLQSTKQIGQINTKSIMKKKLLRPEQYTDLARTTGPTIPTYSASEDLLGQKKSRQTERINKVLLVEASENEITNIKTQLDEIKNSNLDPFKKFAKQKLLNSRLKLIQQEMGREKY